MGRKILIVDDDKEIRKLVEIYLRNEGFEIKVFWFLKVDLE